MLLFLIDFEVTEVTIADLVNRHIAYYPILHTQDKCAVQEKH